MQKLVPFLRQLDAAHFTSGEEIAIRLGVSRASVSTVLARAEEYGVGLERRHGMGYRLLKPLEWLDPLLVAQALPAGTVLRFEVLDSTESTNRVLLASPCHGRVLAAEWQSAGRGRMGRKWQSMLGASLLFSLVWTFPEGLAQLAGLPLAVGVALKRAISAAGVEAIRLKWPNDLLLPEGKAGGILIEMQGDAMGPAQVVIGIGLNILAPQGVDQAVAALANHGLQLGRNALLGRVLSELEISLQQFSMQGFSALRQEWESSHAWQGQQVEIYQPHGGILSGIMTGVSDDGSLCLQVNGETRLIHSGDVSLRSGAI